MLPVNDNGNRVIPEAYSLMVCWPYTILSKDPSQEEEVSKEFEAWIKENFGMDCVYVESVVLSSDRTDVLFAVDPNSPGMSSFMVRRLSYHMRWLEDCLDPSNNMGGVYPPRIHEYVVRS